MTNYLKLTDLIKKESKGIEFTHTIDENGSIEENKTSTKSYQWDNIILLDGTREKMYQYLVWDNSSSGYFIELSKDLLEL